MSRWSVYLFIVFVITANFDFACAGIENYTSQIEVSRFYGSDNIEEKIQELAMAHDVYCEITNLGGVFQKTIQYIVIGEKNNIALFLHDLDKLNHK